MAYLSVSSLTLLRIMVLLATLVMVSAFSGVAASQALAGTEGYCYQWVNNGNTCTSGWHHLIENGATTQGAGSLCIDEYLDPSGSPWYTEQYCTTTSTAQYPGATWGYGRAWETHSPNGFINSAVVF